VVSESGASSLDDTNIEDGAGISWQSTRLCVGISSASFLTTNVTPTHKLYLGHRFGDRRRAEAIRSVNPLVRNPFAQPIKEDRS